MASLTESRLSQRERDILERGYYENLLAVDEHNPALEELYSRMPADWNRLQETAAYRERDDLLIGELVPGSEVVFKRAPLTVNRWGMRDRDYTLGKAPGVIRIALIGASHSMGSGVDDSSPFEAVLEEAFNSGREAGRMEVLNFSLVARTPLEFLRVLPQALEFDPDIVMVVGHRQQSKFTQRYVSGVVRRGLEFPEPEVQELVDRAGVGAEMEDLRIREYLRPVAGQLDALAYLKIAQLCEQAGVTPMWLYLPMIYEETSSAEPDKAEAMRELGYRTLDLRPAYEGYREAQLRLAEWDLHPNELAHRLLADRLLELLRDEPELRELEERP
jgi:hypothetical protein